MDYLYPMDWFIYVLFALACYGGVDFLQKAAALADSPSRLVVRTTAIVVAGISLLAVLLTQASFESIEDRLVYDLIRFNFPAFGFDSGLQEAFKSVFLYALINSSFFAIGSIARITSLKKIPAAFVFPVAKTSAVFLILIGVVFFGDQPNFGQWLGIVLSITLVFLVGRGISQAGNAQETRLFPQEGRVKGFVLALVSACCTTITILAGRAASKATDHHLLFMLISYSMVVVHTFIIEFLFLRQPKTGEGSGTNPGGDPVSNGVVAIASGVASQVPAEAPKGEAVPDQAQTRRFWHRHPEARQRKRRAIYFGAGIGTLNFFGYLAILSAFAGGPLALIQGITSTSFVIPIVLSALVFGEKLDRKKLVVVGLAVISVILQR